MNELVNELTILDVPDVGPTDAKQAVTDWNAVFVKSTVTATDLQTVTIQPREKVLGDWFREGDLGYVYAPRGIGKTWLGMHFAEAIATGSEAGPWRAAKPRRVLYVDGEMPLDLTKHRHHVLSQSGNNGLMFLHHEIVFSKTGEALNLSDPLVQGPLLRFAVENKIEVLVLDNLSCLFSGVKENDADAWELILPWLLRLRRSNIAVMFIAHAGRNGLMRGTSRREDAATWIMALSEPAHTSDSAPGARFVARFTKCRNTPGEDVPPIEWHFRRESAESVKVNWKQADPLEVFRGWIEQGLDNCTDIAAEMGVSKGTISKLAARGQKAGWLSVKGRRYVLVANAL